MTGTRTERRQCRFEISGFAQRSVGAPCREYKVNQDPYVTYCLYLTFFPVSPFDTQHLRGIEIRAMVKLLFFALVGSAALFNSAYTFGQALETVRVGVPSPSLSVLALRTAQVKNLFREEGLDVSLIQLATNVTITALTTKVVDYSTASVAAMRSAISGLPVRTVMFEHAYR